MLTGDGYRIWVDSGAPSIVVGATSGDLYLDPDTGILYRLDQRLLMLWTEMANRSVDKRPGECSSVALCDVHVDNL